MSYGLSTFTVNENFKSLSLQRKGRVSFSNKIAKIPVANNEVAVLSASDGQVCLLCQEFGVATLATTGATFAEYMIFSTNVPRSSGYGIEVYNAKNEVVFSSNQKFLRPVVNMSLARNKGNFNYTGEASKQYGVVLANYGFDFTVNPDNGYSTSRSAHVNGRVINFGFCRYDYTGLYKTGMSYDSSATFFNALIVDITGY